MKTYGVFFLFILFVLLAGNSARSEASEGVELGNLVFHPEVGVAGTYDNRVLTAPAESDFYSEASAGLEINNLPARYNLAAFGRYGQRFYSEYTELDDDFYSVGAGLKSEQQLLKLSVSADYRKTLNYDSIYNPATGGGADGVLTDLPSKRSNTRGAISYDWMVSDRMSLVPGYGVWHNYQKADGSDEVDAEWVVHDVSLPMRYALSDKTYLSAGGSASLQVNKEEDGIIGTVFVRADSRATEKTTYGIMVGVSGADYEESGTDARAVSDARIAWRTTEKVSIYVFGGNGFRPGYSGGPARMVYRAGYGVKWEFLENWFFDGQGLHDYEQAIGSDPEDIVDGGVQHFFTGRIGYSLPRYADISAVARFVNDEEDEDRTTLSLRLTIKI